MASYEALYGCSCKFLVGCFEVGQGDLIGKYLVHEAMEKAQLIRDILKTTKNHSKSYQLEKRSDLEFDFVFIGFS